MKIELSGKIVKWFALVEAKAHNWLIRNNEED